MVEQWGATRYLGKKGSTTDKNLEIKDGVSGINKPRNLTVEQF